MPFLHAALRAARSAIMSSGKVVNLSLLLAEATIMNVVLCLPSWAYAEDRYLQVMTDLLDQQAQVYDILSTDLRGEFSELPLLEQQPTKTYHTHPEAAAARSGGSLNIDRLGKHLNRDVFYYQMSNGDLRNGRNGSRSWVWAKDTAVPSSNAKPGASDIMALVDVDYYVDMPRLLSENFQPLVLYTFCPSRTSGKGTNFAWCFNKDGTVTYRVTGGADYKHPIWSYDSDFVGVPTYLWGIRVGFATYNIDRRPVGDDHYLVLLTPVKRWGWPFSMFTNHLQYKPLDRLDPVQGNYTRMEVMTDEGPLISTGKVGEFIEASIPASVDSMIAIYAQHTKIGLTMAMVQTNVENYTDKSGASVLYGYHKEHTPCAAPTVFPLKESVRGYQFEPAEYQPMEPTLVPFITPIIDGCYAPDATPANEKACVNGRLVDVKSDVKTTPFLYKVMQEFVNQLIPNQHANLGYPYDDDYLYEAQNRPTQTRILREADFCSVNARKRVVNMFIKKEAYGTPNDPRPISTINGVDKADYSRYVYGLSDYIKTKSWYAFGRSPAATAARVAEVCQKAVSHGTNSDFSRFDGRVSEVLRELERAVLTRFFSKDHADKAIALHSTQFGLRAFGRHGIEYNTGFARASGSPETAIMNSIDNAFVAYLAFRMTKRDGSFLTPQAAYMSLGVYGGDDGLTADICSEVYVSAAKKVGQKLVVERVPRGKMGIKFLARIYGPEVWFGDDNSCCDLYRQLSKFHTTVSLPPDVLPTTKLVEKSRAFFLTDANTPIIGPLVVQVTKCAEYWKMPTTDYLRIWNEGSGMAFDEQYPNREADWMRSYADETLPGFKWDVFSEWLDLCVRTQDPVVYLHPPLCMVAPEPVVKVPTVIRGEIHAPKQPAKIGDRKARRASWVERNGKTKDPVGKQKPKTTGKRNSPKK